MDADLTRNELTLVSIPDSPTPDPSPTWASRIGLSPERLGDGSGAVFLFWHRKNLEAGHHASCLHNDRPSAAA